MKSKSKIVKPEEARLIRLSEIKISCLIYRKDCLPPPVRLHSSYLKHKNINDEKE